MRYTIKDEHGIIVGVRDSAMALIKLGELEDAEEELGTELMTVIKGGKEGIYYDKGLSKCIPTVNIKGKYFVDSTEFYNCGITSCFTNYYPFNEEGYTWSLTENGFKDVDKDTTTQYNIPEVNRK